MNKLDQDMADFEEFKKELFEDQQETGCACRPMMRNAGTYSMEFLTDNQGCPIHCNHKGINTWGEWYCNCGASWED